MSKVSVLILGEDLGHDATNDWHKVSQFTKNQLETRYPGQVDVSYMTIEDALNNFHSAPNIGPEYETPVVFVGDDMISQGKKISVGEIAQEVEKRLH